MNIYLEKHYPVTFLLLDSIINTGNNKLNIGCLNEWQKSLNIIQCSYFHYFMCIKLFFNMVHGH